jgi:hypothetical protein
MPALSIILFFVYAWGFGLGAGLLARESEDFLERNLMRIGIGLGAMLSFGLLLNLLKIPLDWRIFLSVSILLILIGVWREFRKGGFSLNPKGFSVNIFSLLMLILFFASFYMYSKGAFAYPYLEDDDSWSHAMGAKYVAIEKTVFAGVGNPMHYLDPYPPLYDMLMGILHQANNSVFWTLKFFNALIVSLSIIFFYFFAKEFTASSKKAMFASFALFAVPAYLSHFIWAIALTMPLFFASFYCIEKIKHDGKWWMIAAIVVAAAVTSSPTHSAYFGMFLLIYLIGRTFAERKFLMYEFIAGFCGLLLSSALWWIPMIRAYGFKGLAKAFLGSNPSVVGIAGTGDRVYSLSDFIFAQKANMINNPIGIGIILSILAVIGAAFMLFRRQDMFRKENCRNFVVLLWLVFAFYAVNAARFPVKLSPFRAWILLAVPVSLLSGEAISLIENFAKGVFRSISKSNAVINASSLLVIGVLFYGIIVTSFLPKYAVNTALWPPGGFWTSNEELQGYMWFKENILSGKKVFTFSNNALILGLDKFICHWCDDVRSYQRSGFSNTAEKDYEWLKKGQYSYIIIDGQAARKFGSNETNRKVQGFIGSEKFRPVFSNSGFIIFEIM